MKPLAIAAALALTAPSFVNAQGFTVSTDTVIVGKTVTNSPVKGTFTVAKTLAGNVNYSWYWTPKSAMPSGWDFQICDPNLCHNFGVSNADFDLTDAYPSGQFYVDMNPMGMPGSMDGTITVFPTSAPGDSEVVFYRFSFWPLGSGEQAAKAKSIEAFPNPTRDYLNVQLPAGNGRIEVYNVLGARVSAFQVSTSGGNTVLPLLDLPKGAYILRYQSAKGLLSKTFYKVD